MKSYLAIQSPMVSPFGPANLEATLSRIFKKGKSDIYQKEMF